MARRTDFELTAADRFEARRALEVLEGSGISLLEAARVAMDARGKKASSATTIEAAIDGFTRRCLDQKLREASIDFYAKHLKKFDEEFSGRTLDDVSRKEIRDWIDALPVSRGSAKGTYRSVRALYSWAEASEHVG